MDSLLTNCFDIRGKRCFGWVHRCRPEDFRGWVKVNVCNSVRDNYKCDFNFSTIFLPHYLFMVQNQITMSLCLTIVIWLSGSAYCEAVWSAILAITWLLVLFGPFYLWLTIIWNGAFSAVENIFHWAVYKLTTVAFILFGNMPVLISDFKIYVPVGV